MKYFLIVLFFNPNPISGFSAGPFLDLASCNAAIEDVARANTARPPALKMICVAERAMPIGR